jgi:hypothetical protein
MKFAIKPMSKAFFGPMRSQIKPAGKATKPVASALMVNIMPMKSGWKPISLRLRYRLNITPHIPLLKPCRMIAIR